MNSVLRRSLVVVLALGFIIFLVQRRANHRFFPRLNDDAPSASKLESLLKDKEEDISKNPNDLKSLVDRGVVYYWMGPAHYADALNSLNAARKGGAFDERIFYYSGVLYENISLFEEAQKQYERFLNHVPDDREIRLRLARLLFRMGKWEESIARYQALVEENGKDFTSVINCGLAYQKISEGLQSKAAKPSPEDAAKIRELEDQAIVYLERATALGANLPDGVGFTLAKLYYRKKEWQKAAQAAEPEHQKGSNDAMLLEILSVSYESMGQNEKALEYYTKWSSAAPRNQTVKNKIKNLKKLLKIK